MNVSLTNSVLQRCRGMISKHFSTVCDSDFSGLPFADFISLAKRKDLNVRKESEFCSFIFKYMSANDISCSNRSKEYIQLLELIRLPYLPTRQLLEMQRENLLPLELAVRVLSLRLELVSFSESGEEKDLVAAMEKTKEMSL